MTRVMIVDDEFIVRECLKKTIAWSDYGCEIAGEARDGDEALQVYKNTLPDIVITDIVMTPSNGLDFIANMRAINPDVEIIILSGYDNFEYAKIALEQGVSAYLLKPIDNDSIIAEILKIKSKLEKKEKAKEAFKVQVDVKKNNFLLEIIGNNELTPETLNKLCERYGIIPPSDRYSVAILQIDKSTSGNMNSIFIHLKEILNYCISLSKDYILTSSLGNDIVLLDIYSAETSSYDIIDLLTDVQNAFKTKFHHTVTIGVSGIFKNLLIINRAYNQALEAIRQKAAFGTNSIIKYIDISENLHQSSMELNSDSINQIIQNVKCQNTEKAIKIVNDYFDKLSTLETINIASIKNNILELIIMMIRQTILNSTMMYLIFKRNFFPSAELQQLEFLPEIRSWTIDIISKLGKYPQLHMADSYSPTINKALLYIYRNYSSKIKLESIAKELLISTRSLSRMFLSETGKSFSEHLSEYRIKMSVQLIENTPYKICDIANLVGYNDIKHFYKTFKKITGHNPKYYKRNSDEEDI